MARAKDTQRARCYKAEREVFTFHPGRVLASAPGSTPGAMKMGRLVGVTQIAELQHLIGSSKRILTKYRRGIEKKVALKIDGRRTRGGAASYGGIIKYSPMAMVDWVVCHEMAHELNDVTFGIPGDDGCNHASHGWRFCAIYIDVVRFVMGKEASEALKESFRRNRVRFTPPTKKRATKPPTPAQIAARAAFAEKAKQRATDRRARKQMEWIDAQAEFYLLDAKRWGVPMTDAEARAKASKLIPSNLL